MKSFLKISIGVAIGVAIGYHCRIDECTVDDANETIIAIQAAGLIIIDDTGHEIDTIDFGVDDAGR